MKCTGLYPHEISQPCRMCLMLEKNRLEKAAYAAAQRRARASYQLRSLLALALESIGLALTRLAARIK